MSDAKFPPMMTTLGPLEQRLADIESGKLKVDVKASLRDLAKKIDGMRSAPEDYGRGWNDGLQQAITILETDEALSGGSHKAIKLALRALRRAEHTFLGEATQTGSVDKP